MTARTIRNRTAGLIAAAALGAAALTAAPAVTPAPTDDAGRMGRMSVVAGPAIAHAGTSMPSRGCQVRGGFSRYNAFYTEDGLPAGIGPRRFFKSWAITDCRNWVQGL